MVWDGAECPCFVLFGGVHFDNARLLWFSYFRFYTPLPGSNFIVTDGLVWVFWYDIIPN